MFRIDEYIASVSVNLSEKNELLLDYLRKINELEMSEDVKQLLFTLYIEPSRFELTFVLFAYDNHANEVMRIFEDGKFVSSVSSQDIPYFSLFDSEVNQYEEFYEENEWKIYTKEQEVFFSWFLANWKSVIHGRNPIPMYLHIHDEEQLLDLKKEKWISSEELWKG